MLKTPPVPAVPPVPPVPPVAAVPPVLAVPPLNSDENNWKRLISQHELKTINLFAKENWNSILKEKYDISGFPHYVLIDKDGSIIQNKCVHPSNGAEQLIRTHLSK